MRPTVLILTTISLVACAPRQTSPYQQTPLPTKVTSELLRSFETELRGRGVYVLRATGQSTKPNTDEALLYVVQQFKNGGSGYCPVEQEPFITDVTGRRFLTLFAKGNDIMALIYDRTNQEGILSASLTGSTATPMAVKLCQ